MAKRTDNNQKSIMNQFRQLGYSVLDLSATGKGCPDLLIAINNFNYLVEVKSPKGKPTPAQVLFSEKWNATIYVVRDSADVMAMFEGRVRKSA